MVIQPGGDAVGLALAADTTSVSTAIPTLSNGARPRWVYVSLSDSSAGSVYYGIRFGVGTVSAATALNTMGLSGHAPMIVNVAGYEAYTAIANGAATLSVTPLAGVVPGG